MKPDPRFNKSERDLKKRFEKTDIDWSAINRQIFMWQAILHQPKKMLTVSISINYLEDTNPPAEKN
jgi:hypothetical protein